MEKIDDNKTQSGVYTPKIKFVEFIGGKGQLNFISNRATINASQLSGTYFEDFSLELVLFEDGTVDLIEIDTKNTSEHERLRLLEIIEEKTIAPYRGRTVINELMFTSVEKVKDKTIPLYLAVDYQKPIEKLSSLLDDEVELSEDAMDNLNDLLNSWFEDEDFAKEVQEMIDEDNSQFFENNKDSIDDTSIQVHNTIEFSSINDSFSKMKEEKIKELKSKKQKTELEIGKLNSQITTLSKSLKDAESELKLLTDRLEDLQPILPFNGYYFSISERQNEVVTIDSDTEHLIRNTVSKVKSINLENFMNLFKNGEFHIHLGKEKEGTIESFDSYEELESEVLDELVDMGFTFLENKMVYEGESTWGELVNKMVKKGFKQDPDFDEISFPKETTETVVSDKNKKSQF